MKFSPPDLGPSDRRPVIFGKSPLSASPMNGGTNSCTLRMAAQIASTAGSCHEVKIHRAALIVWLLSRSTPAAGLQDLDFLARRDDFLVGQAVRLSPPAVAGVWLRLYCFVGRSPGTAPDALVRLSRPRHQPQSRNLPSRRVTEHH